MVLQAFIDDSYTAGGTFVLAGHIASPEAWASFSKEWQELLPFGTLDKSGRPHFKMSEMALSAERMERVAAFYRVIERHVLASVACIVNMADLERAKGRIWVDGLHIDWGYLDNPYLASFRALLDMFHSPNNPLLAHLPNEKVDFFFDMQTERKVILQAWEDFIETRDPERKELYGSRPRFEDDKEFLPLQAADFWAWWVRRWQEGHAMDRVVTNDFGAWKGSRDYPRLVISFTEDELVQSTIQLIRPMLEQGRVIHDRKFENS